MNTDKIYNKTYNKKIKGCNRKIDGSKLLVKFNICKKKRKETFKYKKRCKSKKKQKNYIKVIYISYKISVLDEVNH